VFPLDNDPPISIGSPGTRPKRQMKQKQNLGSGLTITIQWALAKMAIKYKVLNIFNYVLRTLDYRYVHTYLHMYVVLN